LALGDAYATVAEFKGYADHISDSTDDTQITEVLLQASRALEHVCGRQFNKTTTAAARVYHPDSCGRVSPDDFHTTTDLVIKTDSAGDGTYATTLTSSDYTLQPLNGIVDGESGWPYSTILGVNVTFTTGLVIPPVQVTAQWGWNAVPTNVKVACIYLALETFKLKGAPFGVAGFGDFGPIRVRENPRVMAMLAPYRRYPVLVG
jgi:hypothetical protein